MGRHQRRHEGSRRSTLTAARPPKAKGVLPATGIVKEYGNEIGKGSLHDESAAPELIEQMETLEKVMNRYGNPISSAAVTQANSEAGATFNFNVQADTEYIFLASGTNAHGTTIEQTEVKIPGRTDGEADYERYIGTRTVTSTSSEINKQPPDIHRGDHALPHQRKLRGSRAGASPRWATTTPSCSNTTRTATSRFRRSTRRACTA